jgi:hypothetical protein
MNYSRTSLLIIGVVAVSLVLGHASISADSPTASLVIKRFPAAVGNSWEYQRTFHLVVYDTVNNDTTVHVIIDSLHSEFQGIDTLGGWECYRYLSQLFQDGDVYSDTKWYAHPDTAFLGIAATPPTHSGPPWKIARTTRLKFAGREFSSVRDLSRYLYQTRNSHLTSTYSGTVFLDPPKKLFVFPLTLGTSWISMTDPWEVEREVVSEEWVHVQAGDFLTLKIEMRPDVEGLELYEWLSDEGSIKDSAHVDSITITDPTSPEPIGYGVAYDKYELLGYQTSRVKMCSFFLTPKKLNVGRSAEHTFMIHLHPCEPMDVSKGDSAEVYVDVDASCTFDADEQYPAVVNSPGVVVKVHCPDLVDNDPKVAIYSVNNIPISDTLGNDVVLYLDTFTPEDRGPESHASALLDEFTLGQNTPNPFNPVTSIQYTVDGRQTPIHTTLKIYDILGRLTRTLVDEPETGGFHEITWDGKDDNGKEAVSGIYFYRLTAGDFSETKKMLLLR